MTHTAIGTVCSEEQAAELDRERARQIDKLNEWEEAALAELVKDMATKTLCERVAYGNGRKDTLSGRGLQALDVYERELAYRATTA